MRKSWLGFALAGVLAATGCKDASTHSSAQSSKDDSSETNPGQGRSGKVDLGTPRARPSLADDQPSADDGEARRRERPSVEELEERRKQRMAQFDTDGDGKISEEERTAARRKRAEDMLSRADANGDGKVTPDELAQGRFRRMNPESLDTNKDGQISADELDAALAARTRAWGAGRFGRFDRAQQNQRMGRVPNGDQGSGSTP